MAQPKLLSPISDAPRSLRKILHGAATDTLRNIGAQSSNGYDFSLAAQLLLDSFI